MATDTKQTEKPAADPKLKATIAPHACECGCGTMVTSKARFVVGHDAKLKSQLINTALGSDKAAANAAQARIQKLGWTAHLEASRTSRTKKAEAKVTRDRAAADAKHAKAEADAKAKAEKAAKATAPAAS